MGSGVSMAVSIQRRHHQAKLGAIAVILGGIIVGLAGVWALLQGATGMAAWPIALVIVGPILSYLGFVVFYTYLERLERERYLPNPARPEPDDAPTRHIYPYGH